MVFSALALSAAAVVPKALLQQHHSPKRAARVARPDAAPAFATRRRADAGLAASAKSFRGVASRLVIARAGGEGDELDDEENARRSTAGGDDPEVEVVEEEEAAAEDDAAAAAEEEAAAPPSRCAEIVAALAEAGADAALLEELGAEVAGIESAFKDIQAANVGLEDQAAATKDQFLRLNADFDNYKKRTAKEKLQLGETAKSKVFEGMLTALDNFDLAKQNLKAETEGEEKILSQYQGLVDGLMQALSAQGLTPVEGVGTPFDPNFHEAIMREDSDEPEDVIIEEFRKGYKLGEATLVRASMVKVSAGPAAE